MAETTGTVDYVVGSETFQTWYRIVGSLSSGKRPVVVLHGGPGISHHYISPLEHLNFTIGVPVILYDQVGIGKSSSLKGKSAKFFTVDLFIGELVNLLEKLGIADDYDLYGHSWGGMLASSFVSQHPHPGLKRLILSSTPASVKLWEVGTSALLKTLPEDVQETIKKHEADGTTDSQEYQEATQVFYGKYVCTLSPWPDLLLQSFAAVEKDPTVYSIMLGPSEFNCTGVLKTWDVTEHIHKIDVPTLIINGPRDEAQDVCVRPFFEKVPKVKWVQLNESTHTPFFEEKERYFNVLGDFLTAA